MIFRMFSPSSIRIRRIASSACAAALALAMIAGKAAAQSTMQGVPNAMQGFSQNRDQPIQIEAASLELRAQKNEATFAGNGEAVQGDSTRNPKAPTAQHDSSRDPGAT